MTQFAVDLDERTKEELQPPCDYQRFHAVNIPANNPCGRPATLIRRAVCTVCNVLTIRLRCCPEHIHMSGVGFICTTCGATGNDVLHILSVEPL